MSRWFRFYDGALDDPKVQRLDPDLFKAWINILCLASRNNGKLPCTEDIAFALRVTPAVTAVTLQALRVAGLLDGDEPHNWGARQYKSDVTDPTNAQRQKRFRDRHRNTVTTVTVTPLRADTEQSVEARKRASRLPDDWAPSSEDRAFAKALGFSDQQIDHHAARFRDFWRAKPGAGGTKLDWPATWRNWMRSEDERRPKPRPTDDWRNPLAGVR